MDKQKRAAMKWELIRKYADRASKAGPLSEDYIMLTILIDDYLEASGISETWEQDLMRPTFYTALADKWETDDAS